MSTEDVLDRLQKKLYTWAWRTNASEVVHSRVASRNRNASETWADKQ